MKLRKKKLVLLLVIVCAKIWIDHLTLQAAMNVGGIVLNALAIEHFILRHPSESKHVCNLTYFHNLLYISS